MTRRNYSLPAVKSALLLCCMAVLLLIGTQGGIAGGDEHALKERTSVMVESCPSTYGAFIGGHVNHIAASEVDVPRSYVSSVRLYTNSTKAFSAVLAPSGWSCRFLYSGDGTVYIQIQPKSEVWNPDWWSRPPKYSITAEAVLASQQGMLNALCQVTSKASQDLNVKGLVCPVSSASVSNITALSTRINGARLAYDYMVSEGSGNTFDDVLVLRISKGVKEVVTESCALPTSSQSCSVYVNDLIAREWELK
jgi:hypothetical protein